MIKKFDILFDTYEKRVVMIEIMLLCWLIVLCFRNYVLGINLIHFDSGLDLFSLIELKDSTNTFFGRFLEYLLNSDLSFWSSIKAFFSSFSCYEIGWLALLLCFIFENDKNSIIKMAKRAVLIFSFCYVLLCSGVMFLGIYAYKALSTAQAVQRLSTIGKVLSCGSVVLVVLMLIQSFLQLVHVFSKDV